MEKLDIMKARHSVRTYLDKVIESEKLDVLNSAIAEINAESGLNVQLFVNEPEAFKANASHYGAFEGCRNYFAMVGGKNEDEKIGYYGEKLVLLAQELGLNTCWVALTYKRGKVKVNAEAGEKLHLVIALGYGKTQGHAHTDKPLNTLCNISDSSPDWFKDGMAAVLLAPTAINQQKFYFEQKGETVSAKAKLAFYSKVDLGIAKLHFELGAGKDSFRWE